MRNLNLLILRCDDLERCRVFYEVFGLRFSAERHGDGPGHYAHADEGGVFELYPRSGETPADATGLGFAVPHLEVCREAISKLGSAPGAIKENPWGRTFVVRDPDNRRVEVSESK